MGRSSKDAAEKREAPDKALRELMDLFQKLNSKLRGKIFPRRKKEKGETEMVIIILNRLPENTPRPVQPEKPKPPKPGWIHRLCEEIEREGGKEEAS